MNFSCTENISNLKKRIFFKYVTYFSVDSLSFEFGTTSFCSSNEYLVEDEFKMIIGFSGNAGLVKLFQFVV